MYSNFRLILFFFVLIALTTVPIQNNVNANALGEEQAIEVLNSNIIHGNALKQPVHFYSSPSKDSNILKSYNYNHPLKYRYYSENWYYATVYINGIAHRGYVHKNDVGASSESESVKGIAKQKVNVLKEPKQKSRVWKSYKKGKILKYSSYNNDWYIATVKVNNRWEKGYIKATDVETATSKQSTLKGVGVKNPTKVYSYASNNAKSLKNYKQGSVLKFRTFSKHWYEATVFVKGKKQIGYISAKDVEPIIHKQQTIKGIGLKQPTNVYSIASKNSKSLKSYQTGKILKYRTFTDSWFEATVYVKGKKQTGYIASQDVERIDHVKAQSLKGVATNQKTTVYDLASKTSKPLKSYSFGHHLKFKSFSNNWYEATVYTNGKAKTGYIFKKDVQTNLNSSLNGYALRKNTKVYKDTSTVSKGLKSYKQGKLLKFKPYNNKWFKATVFINGKAQTGFINAKDVSPFAPNLKAKSLKNPTNVYTSNSRSSKVLKKYKQGKTLKFKPYSNNWYIATVYIKGKPKTGYIHVNDVGELPIEKETPINKDVPSITLPILMYHQIGDNPNSDEIGRFVTADNFEKQMFYLRDNGFTPIHFNEIENIENIKKPIIITFDDGYDNNEIAYEILKDLDSDTFHAKATFFIITDKLGNDKYLSEEQVKEMSNSEIISIQSHTMTHVYFNDEVKIDEIDYDYQLLQSKEVLENITGAKVHTLAYPYGAYNDLVIEETKKLYDYAVTTRSGVADIKNPYELSRLRVSFDTTIDGFKEIVNR